MQAYKLFGFIIFSAIICCDHLPANTVVLVFLGIYTEWIPLSLSFPN